MAEEGDDLHRRFFSFSNRISSIEKRTNSIDDQLKMIESDSVEKHKEVIKSLRAAKDEIGNFRAEIEEFKKQSERLIKRLSEFASKESVKVLEKYINLWTPMKFTTKNEVENLIESALAKRVKARPKPVKKVVKKKPVRKKKEKVQQISYAL
jgi:hypothetical protein